MTHQVDRDTRPFLRRPVELPAFMRFAVPVILICEVIHFLMMWSPIATLVLFGVLFVLSSVFVMAMGNKLDPLPPLPEGYVQPMWVVVIVYPVFALFMIMFIASLAVRFF